MRVALLSYRSKPHCGGQGVYVRQLSRELVRLGLSDNSNYQVLGGLSEGDVVQWERTGR